MQPCTYYYSFVRFSTDEEKFNKMALYIYSLLKGKEKKTYFHHHHHCCYCYYFLIQDLCFLFFFLGAFSSIEDVIAKFAQLTPQERAKRCIQFFLTRQITLFHVIT
jgi:uncharacterized membrane protein